MSNCGLLSTTLLRDLAGVTKLDLMGNEVLARHGMGLVSAHIG